MQYLGLVLWIFALVMWVLASLQLGDPNWRRLVSAGLACMAAAVIFGEGSRIFIGTH